MKNAANLLRHWSHPVWIAIGYGFKERITGPEEALDCLEHRWPNNEGKHFAMAFRCCTAATTRAVSIEEAREKFVSAAIEAYVLHEVRFKDQRPEET